jgi:hypothetical protein
MKSASGLHMGRAFHASRPASEKFTTIFGLTGECVYLCIDVKI